MDKMNGIRTKLVRDSSPSLLHSNVVNLAKHARVFTKKFLAADGDGDPARGYARPTRHTCGPKFLAAERLQYFLKRSKDGSVLNLRHYPKDLNTGRRRLLR